MFNINRAVGSLTTLNLNIGPSRAGIIPGINAARIPHSPAPRHQ